MPVTTPIRKKITVKTIVQAPLENIWNLWTDPAHIIHWNQASDDWFTPYAENDLRMGGKFIFRMEARDGSAGFDFNGIYEEIKKHKLIRYRIEDGREVNITFSSDSKLTKVTETFEAENMHSVEMQQAGWQAILDHFRIYAEITSKFERLRFEITIGTDAEKVYRIMLDPVHFTNWTAPFNPTSVFKGSWEKGSRITFVGTDDKGNTGGMVSRIRENIPGKFILMEHIGIIQGDREIMSGPEVESWAGATERYFLSEKNGTTVVQVEMDVNREFKSYFLETWPRALNALKTICES